MCRTYNTIGSLTTLKSQLEKNNIHDFKSLKEVIDFQNSYAVLRQQLLSQHENLIEQEKSILNEDIQKLALAIEMQKQQVEQKLKDDIDKLKQELSISKKQQPTNFFKNLTTKLKHWSYKKKIKHKELHFDFEVKKSISKLNDDYEFKNNRYQFITSNSEEATEQSAQHSLSELQRKKTTIDELNNYIYGALGEQKIVKALEALSDDYVLINDFELFFSTAIYNRQENDYIKSIQIDHILVGPSGVIIIETKNWSEKSLENLSLRSPVQQIKRTNFVLFKLLNNEIGKHHLRLDNHHWGDRKIAIKNIIALIHTKPKEEFQYVKILTTNELIGYITYFKPTFSDIETKRIVDFLLKLNNQKIIDIK